jgi:2-amino-4-hydroxy-6-hydroxymethyldihydropteridine diphosphokinase
VTAAYLGLGSNLGDRAALLAAAVEALDSPTHALRVSARSSVHETSPVGGPTGQPDFLNQVIAVETTLTPEELLARCLEVEASLGRAREREERWGPRAIDIDVLLYGDAVVRSETLTLPHPRLHERAFALAPLCEIAPDVVVPGRGSARELLRALVAG